jgi:hypothetical protein
MPKKRPLYAPMLGSLGGGSVRGFGRYAGGGIELPGEPNRLFSILEDAAYEVNLSNFTGGAALQSSNNIRSAGNFPATMGDIAIAPDGVPWLYTAFGGELKTAKINNFADWNQTTLGYGNHRAMCTLRNNIIVISDNVNNQIKSYRLNSNGSVTHLDTYSGGTQTNNIQFMISPPDYSGGSNILYTDNNLGPYDNRSARLIVSSAQGSAPQEFLVNTSGNFAYVQGSSGIAYGAMTQLPNGYVLWAEDGGSYKLLNHQLNVVSSSNAQIAGSVHGMDVGRDGNIYVSLGNYRVERIYLSGSTIYRNSAISGNSTYTPDYVNSIRCVEDNVYWSGYTGSSSWGKVARHPQGGTQLTTSAVAISTNFGSTYHEQLLSGRPNWANADEAFIEGSGW